MKTSHKLVRSVIVLQKLFIMHWAKTLGSACLLIIKLPALQIGNKTVSFMFMHIHLFFYTFFGFVWDWKKWSCLRVPIWKILTVCVLISSVNQYGRFQWISWYARDKSSEYYGGIKHLSRTGKTFRSSPFRQCAIS